jgi:hypothetical protein
MKKLLVSMCLASAFGGAVATASLRLLTVDAVRADEAPNRLDKVEGYLTSAQTFREVDELFSFITSNGGDPNNPAITAAIDQLFGHYIVPDFQYSLDDRGIGGQLRVIVGRQQLEDLAHRIGNKYSFRYTLPPLSNLTGFGVDQGHRWVELASDVNHVYVNNGPTHPTNPGDGRTYMQFGKHRCRVVEVSHDDWRMVWAVLENYKLVPIE